MELATRKTRLFAAVADAFIVGVPYAMSAVDSIPTPVRLLAVFGSLALLVTQIVMVSRQGQTIGKRFMGIRIVLKDTMQNGGFVANVLKRGFLSGLLNLIPGYFLVDTCFIFRDDRRCLHDMIAGTCVIQAEPAVVQ